MVGHVRLVLARVQLPGQCEKWFGLPGEVCDVKDGGGVRDIVLLQVVIETSPWAPKDVRNASIAVRL